MVYKMLTRSAKKQKLKLKKIIINSKVKKIQKNFRNYSQKLMDKDEESMKNNSNYKNNYSITCLELNEINNKYFYKHSCFFFDIRELEGVDKHPYTTVDFSLEDKKQIKRILYYLKTNYYYYRELNEEGLELSKEERYTAYKTDVFKKIEETGVYLPIDIFDKYTIMQLHIFLCILFKYILIKNTTGIDYYLDEFNKCLYQIVCGLCDIMTLKYKALYILDYISKLEDEYKLSRCLIIRRCLQSIEIIEL